MSPSLSAGVCLSRSLDALRLERLAASSGRSPVLGLGPCPACSFVSGQPDGCVYNARNSVGVKRTYGRSENTPAVARLISLLHGSKSAIAARKPRIPRVAGPRSSGSACSNGSGARKPREPPRLPEWPRLPRPDEKAGDHNPFLSGRQPDAVFDPYGNDDLFDPVGGCS